MIVRGYNYIAVFLTFGCNYDCGYCITRLDGLKGRKHSPFKKWVDLFNNMKIEGDVPITIQGGEPTFYPFFYDLMKATNRDKTFNLMTNLNLNVETFMKWISPEVFNREAPFPSIRVSYHVGQVLRDEIIAKVKRLTDEHYSIGLYMLDHPTWKEEIDIVRTECQEKGIDFRLKEYLDRNIDPKMFKYHHKEGTKVSCRNSDLIIGPDMTVYRCHYDLYTGKEPLFDLKEGLPEVMEPSWSTCKYPHMCNPCDIKIKNNRHQQWGHCSVEIKPL